MYRKNERHIQKRMFSDLNLLPAKVRERLENSRANTFYWEFFMRLDEDIFAVLCSRETSRPNVPVNILVGLETLKAGNGWSDQEMYDAICFDVQVRYALGYVKLGEGHFELRTMYNFRNRISNHMQATGENLIEKAFEQITDEQLAAFQLKTGKQRMDSTQVSSNIREMSRLQLLVEVLQRAHLKIINYFLDYCIISSYTMLFPTNLITSIHSRDRLLKITSNSIWIFR